MSSAFFYNSLIVTVIIFMKPLLSALLFITLFSFSASAQIDQQMVHADSLYDLYEEKAALETYNEILANHPVNFTATWRSSLLYSRIGYRFNDEDKKITYFKTAKKRAEQALHLKPRNSYSNYVMAVAMGRMVLISGAKERVVASRAIKKYGERALRFDSTNAGAWHLLGVWHYEVDNLNFAERLAANVLFGGLPDGANTETAMRYIEKSIELKPEYLLYYYDLATVYEELDKEQAAIAACEEALNLPVLTPTDPTIKNDCKKLIDDLE